MAPPSHEWTKFEEATLLALMVKGTHITKLDLKVPASRKRRYMDIATALNDACHKGQYAEDVPWKDVANKVEQWIDSKRAGVAMMERHRVGHVTRTLKRVWARGIKFTGTIEEWKNGREEQVMEEANRRANGQDWADNPIASVELGEKTQDYAGDGVPATAAASVSAADANDEWGEPVTIAISTAAHNVNDEWGSPVATATSGAVDNINDAWGAPPATAASTLHNNSIDEWGAPVATAAPAKVGHTGDEWGMPVATTTQTVIAGDGWGAPIPSTTTTQTSVVDDPWGASITSANTTRTSVTDDPWDSSTSAPTRPSQTASDPRITKSNTTTQPAAVSAAPTADAWGDGFNIVASPSRTNAKADTCTITTDSFEDPWGALPSYEPRVSAAAMDIATDAWGENKNTTVASTPAAFGSVEVSGASGEKSSAFTDIGPSWVDTAASLDTASKKEKPKFTDPWTADRSRGLNSGLTAAASSTTADANSNDRWGNIAVSPKSAPMSGNFVQTSANMSSSKMEASRDYISKNLACDPVSYGMNPDRLRMLNESPHDMDVETSEDLTADVAGDSVVQKGFKIGGSNMLPLSFNRLTGETAKSNAMETVQEVDGEKAMDLSD